MADDGHDLARLVGRATKPCRSVSSIIVTIGDWPAREEDRVVAAEIDLCGSTFVPLSIAAWVGDVLKPSERRSDAE